MPVTINTGKIKYKDSNDEFQTLDAVGGIEDVQVNGTSVVTNGVANVPFAGQEQLGVVQVYSGTHGLTVNSSTGLLAVAAANATQTKSGTSVWNPLVPNVQHASTFFGLSKAAGVDLANEEVTVGTYPATAKDAIKTMLGVTDPAVSDVQVNGTSVVTDGVANVPLAAVGTLGVISVSNNYGLTMRGDGAISIYATPDSDYKSGIHRNRAACLDKLNVATFFGLAKAAGADMKDIASTTVGTYPEAQKSAISQMLNGSVSITGSTQSITALPGIRYVCGECTTLDITLPASGIVDVVFTSGSTATTLTITPPTGQTLKWANGFDPTSLDANTTYEINIADGLGVAVGWT